MPLGAVRVNKRSVSSELCRLRFRLDVDENVFLGKSGERNVIVERVEAFRPNCRA